MGRTGKALATATVVLALSAACAKQETTAGNVDASTTTSSVEATTTTSATSGTTATSRSTATTRPAAPGTTRVDTRSHETLARQALLRSSDLPPGEWASAPGASRSGSGGGLHLGDTPSCQDLSTDKAAAAAVPTSQVVVGWTQGASKQLILTNDVELYSSSEPLEGLARLSTSSDFATCYGDALAAAEQEKASAGTSPASGLQVTPLDLGISKDDLGVDAVTAVELRFSSDDIGSVGGDVTSRLVFISAGRGLSTVQLAAVKYQGSSRDVTADSVDLEPTLRAAADNLLAVTKPS